MKYTDYNIEDFLADEFFIQWVKHPNDNNRHFWEKWLEQHPEKRRVVMQAVSIISSVRYQDRNAIGDKLYVDIFENILKADRDTNHPLPTKRDWVFSFHWRGIAATFLLCCCIGLLYQGFLSQTKADISLDVKPVLVSKNIPAGRKSLVTLPDGTKIYLNAGSEISYAPIFSDSVRLVQLKGEAFFEVEQEARPFIVEIDQTRVRVLGTSFNVNQKNNGELMVALISGKVSINDQQGNRIELQPSEMMVRDRDGHILKTTFDPIEVIGWKDKILTFKKMSLPQVKEKIENWFGVEVQLEGRIDPDWSYSGIYKDETLENVLKGIFLTSGLKYRIEDKNVIITNPN